MDINYSVKTNRFRNKSKVRRKAAKNGLSRGSQRHGVQNRRKTSYGTHGGAESRTEEEVHAKLAEIAKKELSRGH